MGFFSPPDERRSTSNTSEREPHDGDASERDVPSRRSAAYQIDPEPGRWLRIVVHAAPLALVSWLPFVSLAAGVVFGTRFGMLAVGAAMGGVIAAGAAVLRLVRIRHVLRRLAPAGTVCVCPRGVRLMSGAFIPRHDITYLNCVNVVDGSRVVASAVDGALETPPSTRGSLRCRHPAQRVAYHIVVHAAGRVHPLVGRMALHTARHVHAALIQVLGFRLPTAEARSMTS